jgi:hypothetical protein
MRTMKVNVIKTKVLVFKRDERIFINCKIFINGEKVEQVKEFVYLGSMFTRDSVTVIWKDE